MSPSSDLLRQVSLLQSALSRVETAVCVCDREWKIEFANNRFADVWKLDIAHLAAGTPLTKALAGAADRGPVVREAADEYLSWCRALKTDTGERDRIVQPGNGRRYKARHLPVADRVWLVTLDDVTYEAMHAEIASERLSLQTLIDTVPDYLWIKDANFRFVIANRALATDWGREPSELIGMSDFDYHPPDMAAAYAACERAVMETDRPMVDRHEFVFDSQGAGKWFASTKMPLKDSSGSNIGIVCISRDITELKRAVSFQEGQAAVLEMIATAAPLAEILRAILRLVESQISGARASVLVCGTETIWIGSDDGSFRASVEEMLEQRSKGGEAPFDGRIATAGNGETIVRNGQKEGPAEHCGERSCWSMPIVSKDEPLGMLALHPPASREPTAHETGVIEIASRLVGVAVERQMTEERIRHMANHDALTGLANRSMLGNLLTTAIEAARRQGDRFQVLFIDLDDFKTINDSLGHHVGDELLKEVAARLMRCVASRDSVIRLGGDEFVVILGGQPSAMGRDTQAVERIVASITPPFLIGNHRLSVSCSVGVADFQTDGDTPESLLAKADVAMYGSKKRGKGCFTVYTDTAA